jgi:hypothetical protein
MNVKNADTKQSFWKSQTAQRGIIAKSAAAAICRNSFQHFLQAAVQVQPVTTVVQPERVRSVRKEIL